MKSAVLSVLAVYLAMCPAATWAQSPPPPEVAFDIQKADIDLLLKNSPPAIDPQIRVVDMGKYSVRPDPDRRLPGGYVNALLLKNQATPVK